MSVAIDELPADVQAYLVGTVFLAKAVVSISNPEHSTFHLHLKLNLVWCSSRFETSDDVSAIVIEATSFL